MKRQACIYIAFAVCGAVLLGYVLDRFASACSHSGTWSVVITTAVLALILGVLTAFHAWLALLFTRRSVDSIEQVEGGFLLRPSVHCTFNPVISSSLRLRRKFGEQFGGDEADPKFMLFAAAGKHWVCKCAAYEAAIPASVGNWA